MLSPDREPSGVTKPLEVCGGTNNVVPPCSNVVVLVGLPPLVVLSVAPLPVVELSPLPLDEVVEVSPLPLDAVVEVSPLPLDAVVEVSPLGEDEPPAPASEPLELPVLLLSAPLMSFCSTAVSAFESEVVNPACDNALFIMVPSLLV